MKKRNKDFDRIFLKYYSELCIFAYRYVRSKDTAEDIVQDLFCHFLESGTILREDNDKSSLRSFLYTSTRNRAIDFLRKNENNHSRLEEYIKNEKLESHVEGLLANRTNEHDYRILLCEIRSAISSLPVKTKTVFLMSRSQYMSNKEIAAAQGVSIKAIEKHITKAISFIRRHVQKTLDIPIVFLLFLINV